MARKNNRRKVKLSTLPAVELVGPTPEQFARGMIDQADIIHAESFTRATVHLNRGGTPVARWEAMGRLSDSQVRAIDLCQRLWAIAGLTARVTASYGERVAAYDAETEAQRNRLIDARDDLRRIEGYFHGLERYWAVYELVCRHGEPAGVAGSRLGYGDRSGGDRAHTIVCFVADFIAAKEGL